MVSQQTPFTFGMEKTSVAENIDKHSATISIHDEKQLKSSSEVKTQTDPLESEYNLDIQKRDNNISHQIEDYEMFRQLLECMKSYIENIQKNDNKVDV